FAVPRVECEDATDGVGVAGEIIILLVGYEGQQRVADLGLGDGLACPDEEQFTGQAQGAGDAFAPGGKIKLHGSTLGREIPRRQCQSPVQARRRRRNEVASNPEIISAYVDGSGTGLKFRNSAGLPAFRPSVSENKPPSRPLAKLISSILKLSGSKPLMSPTVLPSKSIHV